MINNFPAADDRIDRDGAIAVPDGGAEMARHKRVLDLLLVILVMPLACVVMAAVALWVFCVSRGGVLYSQQRIGFHGRAFRLFKFRTMCVDADCSCHEAHVGKLISLGLPLTKLDAIGDPRLILGGRFLRAVGLDELPQLFNVLGGSMSLVGPRPCLPSESEHFHGDERRRFAVKPGLTGPWQVGGKNRTTFREMAALDAAYADHPSVSLDLHILLRTAPALVGLARDLFSSRHQPKLFSATGSAAPDHSHTPGS